MRINQGKDRFKIYHLNCIKKSRYVYKGVRKVNIFGLETPSTTKKQEKVGELGSGSGLLRKVYIRLDE